MHDHEPEPEVQSQSVAESHSEPQPLDDVVADSVPVAHDDGTGEAVDGGHSEDHDMDN